LPPGFAEELANNRFCLDTNMSSEEMRRYLKRMLLRYHVDKHRAFLEEAFVSTEARKTVEDKMTEVREVAQALLEQLRIAEASGNPENCQADEEEEVGSEPDNNDDSGESEPKRRRRR